MSVSRGTECTAGSTAHRVGALFHAPVPTAVAAAAGAAAARWQASSAEGSVVVAGASARAAAAAAAAGIHRSPVRQKQAYPNGIQCHLPKVNLGPPVHSRPYILSTKRQSLGNMAHSSPSLLNTHLFIYPIEPQFHPGCLYPNTLPYTM